MKPLPAMIVTGGLILVVILLQSVTKREAQPDQPLEYESGIESDALNTKEFAGNQWINFFVPEGFTADFLVLGTEPHPMGVTASSQQMTYRWQFHNGTGLQEADLRRELETIIGPTIQYYEMPPPTIQPIEGMTGMSAQLNDIRLASGGASFLEEGLFVLDRQLIRYRIFTNDLSSDPTHQCRKSILGISRQNPDREAP